MAKPTQSQVIAVGGTENAERKLDVVFVHGLGGDAHSTWRIDEDQEKFWPRWLAEDFNDVGVWTIGYGAAYHDFTCTSGRRFAWSSSRSIRSYAYCTGATRNHECYHA